MSIKLTLTVIISALIPLAAVSAADHPHKSKYVGQENRDIKSLSEADIYELKNGKGWGLAKAAELNGVPGPIHVLEMQGEIGLSAKQVREIEALFKKMKQEAIPIGLELIKLESELNNHFANKTITYELLGVLLERVAQVHKKLRYTHLSAHLKTQNILEPEQIELYNKLRGYSSDDPCENIPTGHD